MQTSDLVFRSRGLVTTSAILLEYPGKAVVSAPLLRIRIKKPEKVLPEYLNWYNSQQDAQHYFARRQEGTSINMVSRKQLEDLPVEIPPMETQRSIIQIAKLASQEQEILKRLADKREAYIRKTLLNNIQGKA